MTSNRELIRLCRAIAEGDQATITQLLVADPELALARLAPGKARSGSDEFFLEECHMNVYSGATALHVAAASYDRNVCSLLVDAGANVRARDRRGGEPLHSAVIGVPGSNNWDPARQVAVISYLVERGADPDATAVGGVTPLHRAVRNRCSAAVQELLDAGADPNRTNDSGSTAVSLARWTTGRGGSGSPEAKAEQEHIIRILRSG